MQHDHDIGALGQGFGVAGLLVAPVAVVLVVNKMHQPEFAGHFDGPVGAEVVHQDSNVDNVGKFVDRNTQRLLGVVGGHDHCNALAVDHRKRPGTAGLHSS